jgi:hypothetical protein
MPHSGGLAIRGLGRGRRKWSGGKWLKSNISGNDFTKSSVDHSGFQWKESIKLDYKKEAAEKLRSQSFRKEELPDISGISLAESDEKVKIQKFLDTVKNPYLFRVGDIGVHVVFSGQSGDSLQAHIRNLLSAHL